MRIENIRKYTLEAQTRSAFVSIIFFSFLINIFQRRGGRHRRPSPRSLRTEYGGHRLEKGCSEGKLTILFGCMTSLWTSKVNSTSGVTSTRTAEACEIRWKGHLHPSINHGPWSSEELEKLRTIIAAEPKPVKWTRVAKELGVCRPNSH